MEKLNKESILILQCLRLIIDSLIFIFYLTTMAGIGIIPVAAGFHLFGLLWYQITFFILPAIIFLFGFINIYYSIFIKMGDPTKEKPQNKDLKKIDNNDDDKKSSTLKKDHNFWE